MADKSFRPHIFSARSIQRWTFGYVTEVVTTLRLAIRRWQDDDGSTMAAAVAYYLALSLFPMLLLLTSGLGLFLKFTNLGRDAEVQILTIVAEHCSPSLGTQVEALLVQFQDQSIASGPIGLITAILAAIGVFFQFERGFDKIWRIPPPKNKGLVHALVSFLTQRLFAFLLLCGLGVTIAAILIANVALSAAMELMGRLSLPGAIAVTIVDATGTMLLNWLVFGLIYRWLPKRRVSWSDALRSGLLVAIIWEVGRHVLCYFLIGMRYTSAYGTIGSFIALLLWFYWGVTILFFGAEYLQVLTQQRKGKVFSMFSNDTTIDTENPRIKPRRKFT